MLNQIIGAKSKLSLLCLTIVILFNNYAYAKQTLIFAIDIVRHGDRTPTIEIPNDPYKWPEGLGELTPDGMKQEFDLGCYLRKLYIDQYKLLPEKYNSKLIYVRSSDYNRTLMSAQSLLLGLYPHGTGPNLPNTKTAALPEFYQPIPIHTTMQSQDYILTPWKTPERNYDHIEKYAAIEDEWQRVLQQYKPKLQRWSNLTGLSLTKLNKILSLGDNLYIRKLYQVPMPHGINNEEKNEIISLSQWVFKQIFTNINISRLDTKELRLSISNYLYNAQLNKSTLKYVLFSAHDTTIMTLLATLNYKLEARPPYTSDLQILLFKDDTQNAYFIKLIYNKSDIILPGCQAKLCSLEEFNTLLTKDSDISN